VRVLAVDPGALRQGWAIVDGDGVEAPKYKGSGISGLVREDKEAYQEYRLRLVEFWAEEAGRILRMYKPDKVVTEIIPVKGGGQFVSAAQSQLAATAVTSFQAIAYLNGYSVAQIGSTTVKKAIAGSNKATKVGIRNGVWVFLPSLRDRAKQWTKVFDESDALAIALCSLGYKTEKGATVKSNEV
jgi:Holliday junction resolvasome RuvABC endonuclease subunit